MAKPFSLIEGKDVWGVTWLMFPRQLFVSRSILDIVFDEINCEAAALLIQLNNKENETFTVDKHSWAQDLSGAYGEFLQDQYVITGAVFKIQKEAENFYEWLEKAYVWNQLKV